MLFQTLDFSKVAVISDPHAHLATTLALIAKIPSDYVIIFNGDLIDKGKRAKELVELVKTKYFSTIGNHDHLMTTETRPQLWKQWQSLWIANSGKMTHKSYGDKWKIQNDPDCRKIFIEHRNWLRTLPLVIHLPNIKVHGKEVVISHSSLHKTMSDLGGGLSNLKHVLNTNSREDLLGSQVYVNDGSLAGIVQEIFWNFNKDINLIPDLGIFNVFGHSTQDSVKINNHCACIDTGVYLPNKLSALLLPDLTVIEQVTIAD